MRSSLKNKKEFIFGSFLYHYDLIKQDRKTLSLTVTPDLNICVKCPHRADDERIETFLRKKWFWLEKQLSFFRKYQRKTYQKEYVSGEGFLYLGRQYKLLVRHSSEDKVTLSKGILLVQTTKGVQESRHTKKLVSTWYEKRIEQVFTDRYEEVQSRFDYKSMPRLVIREMQKRWGSFIDGNIIVLNPQLIHVSRECIDYVIVHELCHMKYKNHNANFYKLLKKKYPKWEKVKDKLETIGVQTR